MMRVRRAEERGKAEHGWLSSRHTFSFAGYYDHAHMGFQNLRVINEDRVVGGAGFGTHPHRNMEIISYVLEGALEHRDSMGTGSVITPGEVQLMSAGRGVLHSEYNASSADGVRFLQIWILPNERGGQPDYQQRDFPMDERRGQLRLLVSPGDTDALRIRADARLYGALLAEGEVIRHPVAPRRSAWVQVARGRVRVNGETLGQGDGLAATQVTELQLEGVETADVLLFDLPDLDQAND